MILLRIIPAALLFAALMGSAQAQTLTEFKWLAPGADPVAQVTRAPAECLKPADDPRKAYQIEVGRVAFRTPELLGGQAARVGLSCDACHINGHNNPTFFIDGVSGIPGTIDVTSEVFSKVRGDNVLNPRPIPSLVGTAFEAAYGHDAKITSLAEFVHGVVVEEFQGAEPDKDLFDALVAYVRSLDPASCPGAREQPITLTRAMADIERAAAALDASLDHGNRAVGDMLVLGIRSMLGRLDERFSGVGLADASTKITESSRKLGDLWRGDAENDERLRKDLAAWRGDLNGLRDALLASDAQSLFNPEVVARLDGAKP
jgi:hypothetical protein